MDKHDPPPLSEAWLAQLQSSGYRLTAPMRAIVELLASSERALGPVELYDLGRRAHPKMGLATVYRTLEKLQELGLVQRVHQEAGCHMYLRAPRGHEHLMLCSRCGRAAYFSGDDCCPMGAWAATAARKNGFQVQEHWLQLYGLCADCQSTPDNSDDENPTL